MPTWKLLLMFVDVRTLVGRITLAALAAVVTIATSLVVHARVDAGTVTADAEQLVTVVSVVGLVLTVGLAVSAILGLVIPLQNMDRTIVEFMAGNLSARIPLRGPVEMRAVAEGINSAVETIEGASVTLLYQAGLLAREADTLATAADALQRSADSTAAQSRAAGEDIATVSMHMDSTSMALNTMAASSAEIARNAEQVALAASDSVHTAQTSLQQAADLVASGAAINDVTGTIAAIARQTKLLALNAAIEAAAADKGSEGFAVVAGEVKALAGKTGQATTLIRELVDQIGVGVNRTRDDIDRLGEQARTVLSTSEAVRAAVDARHQEVQQLSTSAASIAAASQRVREEVQTMADDAQRVLQQSMAVRGAAGSLTRIAALLNVLAESLSNAGGTSDPVALRLTHSMGWEVTWYSAVHEAVHGRPEQARDLQGTLPTADGCWLGEWQAALDSASAAKAATIGLSDAHRLLHDRLTAALTAAAAGDAVRARMRLGEASQALESEIRAAARW